MDHRGAGQTELGSIFSGAAVMEISELLLDQTSGAAVMEISELLLDQISGAAVMEISKLFFKRFQLFDRL